MPIEGKLREFVLRGPAGGNQLVLRTYRFVNRIRYRRRWDLPVAFRGYAFIVGRDESLYPAVANGAFERDELDWLTRAIRPGQCVWDVGANIGLYSIVLAGCDSSIRVEAFEPVKQTRALLERNLEANETANVQVHPIGLGASDGFLEMKLASGAAGSNSLIGIGDDFASLRTESVQIARADTWCAETGLVPQVVKVDIEGFEPQFFEGARDLITSQRPTLLLELNPHYIMADALSSATWQSLVDWLFSLYGAAMLFGLRGPETIRALDVRSIESAPKPLSIGFVQDQR